MIGFLENFNLGRLFLLLFLEEAGIPLPVPGDVFIFIAGTQSRMGKINFLEVVGIVFTATVLGSSILYFISAKLARPVVLKLGKFLRVDETKINKVSRWFSQKGGTAIVIGRLTPGFRTVTSIAAGLLGFPYPTFLGFTGIAAIIWAVLYFTLGFVLGREAIAVLQIIGRYFVSFAVVVLFAVLAGLFYLRKKRKQRLKV
ncbi:hypothetical protein A2697_04050 [Candidatus Curtissbacteria bacterium RIFCSPHIGHO2_01_FULL_41_44]|uniref:VTT domain-containing protein n=1 Tax=Candidatus Curtissbacteria bacterium RIFCSPLOWO2_01_FULL_42_50 TaxID=1797730 RepID=A0A1F5H3A5_9BACT|nr:MAG: hypothetical protein A2697_04050 [Candidatus Curtissbacteria bacterium RIFCSPHIGHO2_01_FULL_41_44]OGD92899.1 MAG: hypothetical protein A3C33_02210 [Candidatus Curtissbacteria bacterium RIFCSPHIGHO2_02_FULL_42_58]OGD96632.1 MAG: hypothetical protein A3E71_00705 [Candidatus Curtissbacteria bacterium RIFCSPHIGHO2_12_FULL_42_33]OGD98524.1 MAG: hypothetical protein A3B54_00285 [Candidatus Curtissbacteria bacterium RIFCSPLOWO2_01_FULL_42_50]OGE02880.1 MAG: hypothetical protein A3G16_04295 [Ca